MVDIYTGSTWKYLMCGIAEPGIKPLFHVCIPENWVNCLLSNIRNLQEVFSSPIISSNICKEGNIKFHLNQWWSRIQWSGCRILILGHLLLHGLQLTPSRNAFKSTGITDVVDNVVKLGGCLHQNMISFHSIVSIIDNLKKATC